MKLLPRKVDINKAQANERKLQVDEGVKLASKIDMLREASLKEEKQFFEWRENNINKIKEEIAQFLEERDNLEKQNNEARKLRDDLLKPLDAEWVEVNLEKAKAREITDNACILMAECKDEEKILEQQKAEISKIVSRVTQNEKDTNKAKSDIESLKELAQREYEMARIEHEIQTTIHEQAMYEVAQRKKEYEVALTVIEIREQEVNEKEVDIINREKHLETQQVALRIAKEALQK